MVLYTNAMAVLLIKNGTNRILCSPYHYTNDAETCLNACERIRKHFNYDFYHYKIRPQNRTDPFREIRNFAEKADETLTMERNFMSLDMTDANLCVVFELFTSCYRCHVIPIIF